MEKDNKNSNGLRRSPRSRLCLNAHNKSKGGDMPRTSSGASVFSDVGIECSPPQKKLSLDDSIEYSPKVFDRSFSPSGLHSQTLSVESPEVGWRWGQRSEVVARDQQSNVTPDSAYAADSSFASAGSSSTEMATAVRPRSLSYDIRREEQRKAVVQEIRRAQRARANLMLKERCAKLEEQLRVTDKPQKPLEVAVNNENITTPPCSSRKVRVCSPDIVQNTLNVESLDIKTNVATSKIGEAINDFFNDSISDDMLIEATQEVESKIVELTQMPSKPREVEFNVELSATAPVLATPKSSSSKEKRSSLYMKFLEDETPDDWFLSLDDVIQQATQNKKSRTPLQRHKSMPTNRTPTMTTTTTKMTAEGTPKRTIALTKLSSGSSGATTTLNNDKRDNNGTMKRHASTHSMEYSSDSTSYRRRQLRLRK